MDALRYLHLKPGDAPPRMEGVAPFKAVIVADSDVSREWQARVSDWLVRSGCRYLMAWGRSCEGWHDSVDRACLEMYGYAEVPDDDFVMTTWHPNEPIEETFWFSERCAMHPSLELEHTFVVHIGTDGSQAELLAIYRAAQEK